jgi:hypothetical protein
MTLRPRLSGVGSPSLCGLGYEARPAPAGQYQWSIVTDPDQPCIIAFVIVRQGLALALRV